MARDHTPVDDVERAADESVSPPGSASDPSDTPRDQVAPPAHDAVMAPPNATPASVTLPAPANAALASAPSLSTTSPAERHGAAAGQADGAARQGDRQGGVAPHLAARRTRECDTRE